jgi:Asp-tRNA(Asn)/Glu-tRNA(Gln) amidotransferase A subunit family amidase
VVACGRSAEGLPIGVQVVGRPFHEHEVLAAAWLLEEELGQASTLGRAA